MHIGRAFPFPIVGIDSDNEPEFINYRLFDYCVANRITFTRSRTSHSSDGAHVAQKNWTHVCELGDYHRYDAGAELALLNEVLEPDRTFANCPLTPLTPGRERQGLRRSSIRERATSGAHSKRKRDASSRQNAVG